MNKPTYVVNVDGAVVRDGAYLLVERAPGVEHAGGTLGLPGGTVEQDPGGADTVERTVRRELREEVGLAVGSVEYVLSSTFAADDGTPVLNVVTCCTDVEGEARPRATDEVAAVHWLSPGELAARDDVPAFTAEYVERVEAYRAGD